jgi:2-C-methyl-D-erythritol 2,4-cyclodiphosphate synthase
VTLLHSHDFVIGNIDATVICEAPRLSQHTAQMQINIAQDCAIEVMQVNIKATTTEKLGFTGRGEGIAAEAICLIASK